MYSSGMQRYIDPTHSKMHTVDASNHDIKVTDLNNIKDIKSRATDSTKNSDRYNGFESVENSVDFNRLKTLRTKIDG